MSLSVVILAAGKGTRMRSKYPKVLHKIAHKPMVQHVIDTVKSLGVDNIHLVYGHGGDHMKAAIQDTKLNWVKQEQQLGTGHAMQVAAPHFKDDEKILMVYGDVPLLGANTIKRLVAAQPPGGIGLLSLMVDDPTGYGRIVREHGLVCGIVEHKDASPDQHRIREINTGILVANAKDLQNWLFKLSNKNAQGEYYVTDIIEMAYKQGRIVNAVHPSSAIEVEGVNNRLQLGRLERAFQLKLAEDLMMDGVALMDANRFDLRGSLDCGMDVEIDVNCVFEGKVRLGNNVKVGPNCVIRNAKIGDDCEIKAHSVIEGVEIGEGCTIGPFARLRPGTVLKDGASVGNFVEMKKSTLGKGSKCGHLSYLGDASIGANVNIGAGTITCNYDGVNKFPTVIEDGAFIGSDTQLIAPVTIGQNATIGAGSTITHNVGEKELVISRVKQRHIQNWLRPEKQKK